VNGVEHRVHRGLPPGCGIQAVRVSFGDKLAIVAALRQFTLPYSPRRPDPLAAS
jgi:hypothetical protein